MLQVQTFALPAEQKQANEFLATHKTSQINFHEGMMITLYEEGGYSLAYKIADLEELLQSVEAAQFQQEVAMNTLEYERADLNMVNNKGRYEELSAGIMSCKKAINMQGSKIAFVTKRIEELRAQK